MKHFVFYRFALVGNNRLLNSLTIANLLGMAFSSLMGMSGYFVSE